MATAPDRSAAPSHAPESLRHWVLEVAARTRPDQVHWCDGSEAEYRELLRADDRRGRPHEAERRDVSRAATCTARIRRTSRASST